MIIIKMRQYGQVARGECDMCLHNNVIGYEWLTWIPIGLWIEQNTRGLSA